MLEQVIAEAPDSDRRARPAGHGLQPSEAKGRCQPGARDRGSTEPELQAKQGSDTGRGPRRLALRRRAPASGAAPGGRTGDAICGFLRRADRRHRLHSRSGRRAKAGTRQTGSEEPLLPRPPVRPSTRPSRPAEAARKAEQWEQADRLVRKGRQAAAGVHGGHLVPGTAYYSLDKFAECRDAFPGRARSRPRTARPSRSSGCASSGCKDYERALQDLMKSRILGVGDTGTSGAWRATTPPILMTRIEQFDQALQTLGEFATEGERQPARSSRPWASPRCGCRCCRTRCRRSAARWC